VLISSEGLVAREVQRGWVKVAGGLQPLPVQHVDSTATQGDEPATAQLLKNTVDMDGGQPKRIGKIHRRDWQLQDMVLDQVDSSQPHQHLVR
jgi:hypothetical protein